MPPVRTNDTDAGSSSDTSSKKSPRKGSVPKKWSRDEEARFLDHIDALVKANLWAAIKNDEELRKRGANGVRSHWDAMYKKLKRG